MGLTEDFDDRQTQIEAEAEAYHPYEYETTNNSSWAGALPVKQYVSTATLLCLVVTHNSYRGLYDPEYEKDSCGVGFAW